MTEAFRPGHYLALGLAREDESNETVVVYTRLYPREGLPMSTRRLAVWNESVTLDDGRTLPRFAYCGSAEPGPEA